MLTRLGDNGFAPHVLCLSLTPDLPSVQAPTITKYTLSDGMI